MNSNNFNTMAGWVLGTVLLVFGLKELAGVIYDADKLVGHPELTGSPSPTPKAPEDTASPETP